MARDSLPATLKVEFRNKEPGQIMGQVDCYGLSDSGRVRENNEDQFLIADLRKSMTVHSTSLGLDHHTQLFGNSCGRILMVADGMGAHPAGERESTLAVDGVTEYALNELSWNLADSDPDAVFRFELEDALQHCQEIICRESSLNPRRSGMATTVTFALIRWPKMHLVHAGDCRCYLLRNGDLRLLTEDHNLAQLSVNAARQGGTSPRDVANERGEPERAPVPPNDPGQSPIWNYVGGDCESLQPDVREMKLELGDTMLLCSDGLTRHINDDRLAKMLGVDRTAKATCEALVAAANEAGGKDNITVVVARFVENQPVKERQAMAETTHDATVAAECGNADRADADRADIVSPIQTA